MSTTDEIRAGLSAFAAYARSLKGDEKGEAQLFLDKFFRALGHGGVKEAGATLEFRIAKRPGSAQLELLRDEAAAKLPKTGKKFADLLWPDRVLIEMKKRGEHLERHYDQLFDYWTQIVPQRPPYAILCNFDELWVYDFNTQLFDPVDRLPVRDLAERFSSLGFLFPHRRDPIFDNNRVKVTQDAADLLAGVFRELVSERRNVPRPKAQRYLLQLLVALVSEDLGLLPDNVVTRALGDALKDPPSSFDLLGGLFQAMNTPGLTSGGRFAGVDYFNGGLFATVDPVELRQTELYALEHAAKEDWSAVKPEIFGTLFQQSMDKGERHAHGAHYTSEFDIQKVVGPTITRPWRERITAASSRADLRALLGELRRFRVLDPACGSGNFLYVAYREMKRLERELLVKLRDKGEPAENLVSAVALTQFFGIDKVPFAVELARVTLTLARELELVEAKKTEDADGLLVFEKPLPLANLEKQIVCADSLFTEWPKADAIIGNPPFQSKNKAQQEFGPEYLNKLRAAYPSVPGRADFCVYWFYKAHKHLQPRGHAGLIGTNTIRENYSRVGGLDYIVNHGGVITEAVSTEVWSGEAAVNISIVNWIKYPASGDVQPLSKLFVQKGTRTDSPWETHELPIINSALSIGIDVTHAAVLHVNANAEACFQGQTHGHEGFLLTNKEATEFIRQDVKNAEVVFPYLTYDQLISNAGSYPERNVIDFQPRDAFGAGAYKAILARVRELVLPDREAASRAEESRNATVAESNKAKVNKHHSNFLKRWWLLSYARSNLIAKISALPRYVVIGRNPSRHIVELLSAKIRPNDQLVVFPFADDYTFGILQSSLHWDWFRARCSTLGTGFRYTSETVFDTFPWPQSPTAKQARAVADAAVALRTLRREVMTKMKWSLRDLYRTLDDPGANPLRTAHAKLDAAVRAAYAMPADADALAFLLALNAELAAKEKAGQPVTPPGLPVSVAPDDAARAAFVTGDAVGS